MSIVKLKINWRLKKQSKHRKLLMEQQKPKYQTTECKETTEGKENTEGKKTTDKLASNQYGSLQHSNQCRQSCVKIQLPSVCETLNQSPVTVSILQGNLSSRSRNHFNLDTQQSFSQILKRTINQAKTFLMQLFTPQKIGKQKISKEEIQLLADILNKIYDDYKMKKQTKKTNNRKKQKVETLQISGAVWGLIGHFMLQGRSGIQLYSLFFNLFYRRKAYDEKNDQRLMQIEKGLQSEHQNSRFIKFEICASDQDILEKRITLQILKDVQFIKSIGRLSFQEINQDIIDKLCLLIQIQMSQFMLHFGQYRRNHSQKNLIEFQQKDTFQPQKQNKFILELPEQQNSIVMSQLCDDNSKSQTDKTCNLQNQSQNREIKREEFQRSYLIHSKIYKKIKQNEKNCQSKTQSVDFNRIKRKIGNNFEKQQRSLNRMQQNNGEYRRQINHINKKIINQNHRLLRKKKVMLKLRQNRHFVQEKSKIFISFKETQRYLIKKNKEKIKNEQNRRQILRRLIPTFKSQQKDKASDRNPQQKRKKVGNNKMEERRISLCQQNVQSQQSDQITMYGRKMNLAQKRSEQTYGNKQKNAKSFPRKPQQNKKKHKNKRLQKAIYEQLQSYQQIQVNLNGYSFHEQNLVVIDSLSDPIQNDKENEQYVQYRQQRDLNFSTDVYLRRIQFEAAQKDITIKSQLQKHLRNLRSVIGKYSKKQAIKQIISISNQLEKCREIFTNRLFGISQVKAFLLLFRKVYAFYLQQVKKADESEFIVHYLKPIFTHFFSQLLIGGFMAEIINILLVAQQNQNLQNLSKLAKMFQRYLIQVNNQNLKQFSLKKMIETEFYDQLTKILSQLLSQYLKRSQCQKSNNSALTFPSRIQILKASLCQPLNNKSLLPISVLAVIIIEVNYKTIFSCGSKLIWNKIKEVLEAFQQKQINLTFKQGDVLIQKIIEFNRIYQIPVNQKTFNSLLEVTEGPFLEGKYQYCLGTIQQFINHELQQNQQKQIMQIAKLNPKQLMNYIFMSTFIKSYSNLQKQQNSIKIIGYLQVLKKLTKTVIIKKSINSSVSIFIEQQVFLNHIFRFFDKFFSHSFFVGSFSFNAAKADQKILTLVQQILTTIYQQIWSIQIKNNQLFNFQYIKFLENPSMTEKQFEKISRSCKTKHIPKVRGLIQRYWESLSLNKYQKFRKQLLYAPNDDKVRQKLRKYQNIILKFVESFNEDFTDQTIVEHLLYVFERFLSWALKLGLFSDQYQAIHADLKKIQDNFCKAIVQNNLKVVQLYLVMAKSYKVYRTNNKNKKMEIENEDQDQIQAAIQIEKQCKMKKKQLQKTINRKIISIIKSAVEKSGLKSICTNPFTRKSSKQKMQIIGTIAGFYPSKLKQFYGYIKVYVQNRNQKQLNVKMYRQYLNFFKGVVRTSKMYQQEALLLDQPTKVNISQVFMACMLTGNTYSDDLIEVMQIIRNKIYQWISHEYPSRELTISDLFFSKYALEIQCSNSQLSQKTSQFKTNFLIVNFFNSLFKQLAIKSHIQFSNLLKQTLSKVKFLVVSLSNTIKQIQQPKQVIWTLISFYKCLSQNRKSSEEISQTLAIKIRQLMEIIYLNFMKFAEKRNIQRLCKQILQKIVQKYKTADNNNQNLISQPKNIKDLNLILQCLQALQSYPAKQNYFNNFALMILSSKSNKDSTNFKMNRQIFKWLDLILRSKESAQKCINFSSSLSQAWSAIMMVLIGQSKKTQGYTYKQKQQLECQFLKNLNQFLVLWQETVDIRLKDSMFLQLKNNYTILQAALVQSDKCVLNEILQLRQQIKKRIPVNVQMRYIMID